jgi:hypothetical protein
VEIPHDDTHDADDVGAQHPAHQADHPELGDRTTLALISDARRALAEAATLPDIRKVMEAASVAADAGRRAAKLARARDLTAEIVRDAEAAANEAAAIRIEAQAKAGELLRQMAERGERAGGSHGGDRRSSRGQRFETMGVSKSESSRWQQVAGVPADTRQQYVEETKAAGEEISTDGLLKHAEQAGMETARREDAEAMAVLDRIDPEGAVRQQQAHLVATWATAQARLSRAVTDILSFELDEVVPLLDELNRRGAQIGIDQLRNYCTALERALAEAATLQVIPGERRL